MFVLLFGGLLQQAWAQDRTISGKITDRATSQGLPGVTVIVKGRPTIGTSTNADGTYVLSGVPADATTLVFSFIGYAAQELPITGSSTINLTLATDTKQLSEVVVTALGIEREKKSLGYSSQEVRGDAVQQSGETNIVEGLAGKVAGVQVIGSAGVPGASSKILIRGNNSFTGENQPLFVIDGVPLDNSYSTSDPENPFNTNLNGVAYSNRGIDINPNDIDTYNVLKGPAAAALYGVRAGNGAIIITTKRGRAGQKPAISFDSNVEFSKVNRLLDRQLTYAQGTGGGNQHNKDGSIKTAIYDTNGLDGSGGTSQSWGPTNQSLSITPTDNVGQFFRTGISTTNNFAISAGNDKGAIRFSLGQLRDQGIVQNTDFERYTARVNADTKLSNKVSIGASINYINSGGTRAQQGSNTSGVMLGLTRAPSSFNLKEGYQNDDGTQRTYFFAYDNPYWTIHNNPTRDNTSRILGNIVATWTPLSWLSIRNRGGIDTYADRRKSIFAVGSTAVPVDGSKSGEIREDNQFHRELYNDLTATVTYNVNEQLAATVTIGGNLNERYDQRLFGRANNLSVPGFYNLSNGSNLFAAESNSTVRSAALFYDVNLAYKDMIFVGTTGRRETASTFGPSVSSFFTPSVNGSVVLSQLDALKDSKALTFLKIRAAYAKAGNFPGPYNTQTYYASPTFTDGFTNGLSFPYLGVNGAGLSATIGNSNLRAEKVTSREVGVEARFNDDKITLDVTAYRNTSNDLLLGRPIAATSGYTRSFTNAGSIENKGIEAVVGLTPVRTTEGFNWNILFNYTLNRSKVLELAEGVDQFLLEAAFGTVDAYAIVGKPYGALYGTKWARADNGQLLIGANGRPTLADGGTSSYLANPFPNYLLGIRNNFSYKGAKLSFLLDIRSGGAIWNGTTARLNRLGVSKASEDRDRDYIIPGVKADGSANTTPISAFDYYQRYLGDLGAAGEQQVEDGSWVRLRELSLSYNFNKVAFFQGLEIYGSATNLFLRTNYQGIDPETSLTGSGSNITGLDYFNMPNTRNYRVGIRANF